MKKWKSGCGARLICSLLAVGLISSFAGCKKSGIPQPVFPLEDNIVTSTVEKLGLPWVLSEAETHSNVNGQISYVLRDSTESYSEESPEKKIMRAGISSAITDGERFLQIHFESVSFPKPPVFEWEDWKQQMVFAALLYGGFEDEEELYRAFSEQGVPEGELQPNDEDNTLMASEKLEWTAKLSAGYCKVSYYLINTKMERRFPSGSVLEQSPRVTVAIYESEALYQKLNQELIEKKEALENSRAEAQN